MSTDAFLGGRIRLRQPDTGFRAGMDSVMLAAAVPARAGDSVVEPGCGAGTAALALLTRVPGCAVTGFDIQPDMVSLARENADANGLTAQFLEGSVEARPESLVAASFDHAMMNPPFFVEGPADPSPDPARRTAASADADALARWVIAARKLLKQRGTLTAIVPADRAPALLGALSTGFGGVVLFPLWPRAGVPAKRVIVRAVKGSRTPFALAPGLTLHDEAGYTSEADAILRHAQGIQGVDGPPARAVTL